MAALSWTRCTRGLDRYALAGLVALPTAVAGCSGSKAPTPRPPAAHEPSTPQPTECVERRPSVLFVSPTGSDQAGVDLRYLEELHQQGFEVDYTETVDELTWERARHYHAIVLTVSPDAYEVTVRGAASSPSKVSAFQQLVDHYVDAGGGVLLFPTETNVSKQALSDLTDRWGARIPLEIIVERDPGNIAELTHSSQHTHLAYTGQIFPSPVTEGVKGLWYPSEPAYFSGMTGPLVLDDGWQVVVRGSKTSTTAPVDAANQTTVAPEAVSRRTGEAEPPLVAIREVARGRVGLINQWRQFSFGAGTRWLYDREVLERGLAGKPSDFGRLLRNMLRWLSAPALAGDALGGYTTPPDRFEPPNRRDTVRRAYSEPEAAYDPADLDRVQLPATTNTYRGLIGAQTALGGGQGTVAEWASAARRAHLQFVVFLEPFDRLTPENLATLGAACAQHSGDDLLLLPGFTIDSNLGDHVFFFGPEPAWPPDSILAGPNKSVLYLQAEDGHGGFTGDSTPYLDWVLTRYGQGAGQVGLYDFKDSPHGVPLHAARLYSMAGLRYYRDGSLVEDILDEYLTTAQSTIAPAPVTVDRVRSPAALVREAMNGHSLTYAQAESLDPRSPRGLFNTALRWSHQYDAMPVFTSSGPLILAWPGCHRVITYGGEGFAPALSVMRAPLVVTSESGLKEVRIYDGRRLFRRFALHGARRLERTLVLDGSTQKNLVVVAEDERGGRAVSFPRRSWAEGALAPVFCSDHVNDCRANVLLAHGPYMLPFGVSPAMSPDEAGASWDGGPSGALPPSAFQHTLPRVDTDRGVADASRADQIPLLEMSDEGAVSVRSKQGASYDPRLTAVVNPWHTFGPFTGDPLPFFDNEARYRQWATPTSGPPDSGWAGSAVRTGVSPSLFSDVLTFRQPITVRSINLATLQRNPDALLVVGRGDRFETFDLASQRYPTFQVPPGGWFGLVGKRPANALACVNRGIPLRIELHGDIQLKAELHAHTIRKGDSLTFELACLALPIGGGLTTGGDLLAHLTTVERPPGLVVTRGARVEGTGVIELEAQDGAVEASIGTSPGTPIMTLPVLVRGLNPRWSAVLLERTGKHADLEDRWRALGVEATGLAYVPLTPSREGGPTSIAAGHPVSADGDGRYLAIQATMVGGFPQRWHISINNPTSRRIHTMLRRSMAVSGMRLEQRVISLGPGEYMVVE